MTNNVTGFISSIYDFFRQWFWYSPTPTQAKKVNEVNIENAELLRPSPISNSEEQKQLQDLIDLVLSCKAIKAVCMTACKTPDPYRKLAGAWNVRFEEELNFSGMCNFNEREIMIDPSLSIDEQISSLVFEIINSSQVLKFYEINQKVAQLGSEECTKEIERVEYDSWIIFSQIYRQARVEGVTWLEDPTAYLPSSFKEEWETLKETPHADFYRDTLNNYYTTSKREDFAHI
jgi:hypothetical protein